MLKAKSVLLVVGRDNSDAERRPQRMLKDLIFGL